MGMRGFKGNELREKGVEGGEGRCERGQIKWNRRGFGGGLGAE